MNFDLFVTFNTPYAAFAITIITVILSYLGIKDSNFTEKYLLSSEGVHFKKEYIRLISSGFLHVDIWHLMFNMLALVGFGYEFEKENGIFLFILIYFSSILAGSGMGLFNNRMNPDYQAVGASGGISGIVFAYILSSKPGDILIFFTIPMQMPDWLFGFLYLGLSFFAMRKIKNNIGHDAHLGGAFAGIILISIFKTNQVLERPYLFFGILAFTIILNMIYFYEQIKGEIDLKSLINEFKSKKIQKEKYETEIDMDRLLEKVSKSGIQSLSAKEKQRLEEISKKI